MRKHSFRIAETAIKIAVISIVYLLCSQILGQASVLIPGLQGMITTFVIVYVALMIVSDLTSGSIIQHFFNGARSLFVIAYFIFSLNNGILNYTLGNMSLMIDVRLFLMLAMLFGLLGLAKSIIQAICFVNEKLELPII
jgi:uncharacterized membrane protein